MPHAEYRVDTHAHIFATGLPLMPGYRHAPQHDALLPDYLGLLDAHGITHGVLTAPSFFGTDNSHLLTGLQAARGRLRGTVIVDPQITATALEAMARQHVAGIRLNLFRKPDHAVPDLRSPEYRALFERCAALDWHVEIYGEGPRLANWLPAILETGVNTVVDHFGSPDPAAGTDCAGFRAILSSLAGGRLWVKLSAPYRVGANLARDCARLLLQEGGADRLLWGSDWPWTQHENGRSYAQCLQWLEEWIPDDDARQTILGATPRKLFHFPEAHLPETH
ncbi:MAG: amidohydrolase family protein [Burkholderiales bacterium]|nr:amidohydrolase family protein [Burkholderiales bacterium]